jgi:cell division protein FtsQ
MNTFRRILISSVALIVVVAAIVAGPRMLRRAAFFKVRQVEVSGLRYLDEVDVVRRLNLRPGASTFDDLSAIRRAAVVIPGVTSASVTRALPGTLHVDIVEATPVAVAALPDRVALLDAAGHLLPFDPTRSAMRLPIADQDSNVSSFLGRLRMRDAMLFDRVEAARLDHGDVVLDIGAHHIRLRPEADAAVLQGVAAVLKYLDSTAVAWREIDARYRDRVFVQKGSS